MTCCRCYHVVVIVHFRVQCCIVIIASLFLAFAKSRRRTIFFHFLCASPPRFASNPSSQLNVSWPNRFPLPVCHAQNPLLEQSYEVHFSSFLQGQESCRLESEIVLEVLSWQQQAKTTTMMTMMMMNNDLFPCTHARSKASFGNVRSVCFCALRISRKATVPGLHLLVRILASGIFLLAAFVAN